MSRYKQTKQTLDELSLLRAVTCNLLRSDEVARDAILDSIDERIYDLSLDILLPFSDLVRVYNMPSDEVEHICLVQREKKKQERKLEVEPKAHHSYGGSQNQLEAPLYFKDSMNPIINDAQINYEVNVLGFTNKKEG